MLGIRVPGRDYHDRYVLICLVEFLVPYLNY